MVPAIRSGAGDLHVFPTEADYDFLISDSINIIFDVIQPTLESAGQRVFTKCMDDQSKTPGNLPNDRNRTPFTGNTA